MWRRPCNIGRWIENTGGEDLEYTEQQQYWIWLSSVEGIGCKRFYQLLTAFEEPRAVWEDGGEHLGFLGEKTLANLKQARNERYFYQLFARLERLGVRAITRLHEEYPAALTQIYDPPAVIYVKGNPDLQRERAMAVVGSRRCTREGRQAAREFTRTLAENGVSIVSGLARGIDTCAHEGCLEGGGHTIAVLGSGVDQVYPPENTGLYQRILDSGGAIISEYLPGTPPLAGNFPARNRIISGLSQGVLLVEAAARSGAMITVRYAADQGKEIFAVPGSVYAPQSESPNLLIRDGAGVALSGWDILEAMRWSDRPKPDSVVKPEIELDEEERIVVEPLKDEELSYEELVERTRIPPARLNSLLTTLELRGIIKQNPGKMYRVYPGVF